ncbi:hypothetical protein AAFF_G00317950 [Aldrovandia affinis]|uniref:Uncharacterized protein n=1 Tax=Aldrovandia affinis TaxID=143900 RepID=A0AAD7VZQ0_9TELE|nr:hypothetical protein AAFF_G00317950 [Aldrovandia affinis]
MSPVPSDWRLVTGRTDGQVCGQTAAHITPPLPALRSPVRLPVCPTVTIPSRAWSKAQTVGGGMASCLDRGDRRSRIGGIKSFLEALKQC